MVEKPLLTVFLIVFIIFGSFGLIALLTGVISESIFEKNQFRLEEERVAREAKRKALMRECAVLFKQIDEDSSGAVTIDELYSRKDNIREWFMEKGVGFAAEDLDNTFRIMDADKSGAVDQDEFVQTLMQLCMDLRPVTIMELHYQMAKCTMKVDSCDHNVNVMAKTVEDMVLARIKDAEKTTDFASQLHNLFDSRRLVPGSSQLSPAVVSPGYGDSRLEADGDSKHFADAVKHLSAEFADHKIQVAKADSAHLHEFLKHAETPSGLSPVDLAAAQGNPGESGAFQQRTQMLQSMQGRLEGSMGNSGSSTAPAPLSTCLGASSSASSAAGDSASPVRFVGDWLPGTPGAAAAAGAAALVPRVVVVPPSATAASSRTQLVLPSQPLHPELERSPSGASSSSKPPLPHSPLNTAKPAMSSSYGLPEGDPRVAALEVCGGTEGTSARVARQVSTLISNHFHVLVEAQRRSEAAVQLAVLGGGGGEAAVAQELAGLAEALSGLLGRDAETLERLAAEARAASSDSADLVASLQAPPLAPSLAPPLAPPLALATSY